MMKIKQNKGISLVELMITLIISAGFLGGLMTVYVFGVKEFNNMTSKFRMFEETSWFLNEIDKIVMSAESASIIGSRLTLVIPDISGDGQGSGLIEFFVNNQDHTIRMNDRRIGINKFNLRLLPYSSGARRRRFGTQDAPFRVMDVEFEIPDNTHRSVKVSILVEDDLENTLRLSNTAFLENTT